MVAGERRSEPRRSLSQQQAWVIDDNDQTRIAVMVSNISRSGANLLAEASVPNEFLLYLTPDGEVRRRCRVIWRIEDSIGVCIIADRSRPAPAAPPSFVID